MIFTKQKPTKKGWYWCYPLFPTNCIYGTERAGIVGVFEMGSCLYMQRPGLGMESIDDASDDLLWCGPIEIPDMPR